MNFRIQSSWRILVVVGAILVPGVVAGAFQVPNTFKAGTPIKAAEMNENFSALAAKVDAATLPPVAAQAGTLSLDGAAATPVFAISQSVQVSAPVGGVGAAGKPQFSPLVVRRNVDENSPNISLLANQAKLSPTVTVAVGNLTIALSDARLVGVSVVSPRANIPQEELSFLFNKVRWTWAVPGLAERLIEYDVVKATGGGNGPASYNYGYFPPGLTPDDAYVPILGYQHTMACASAVVGCKAAHAPFQIEKRLGEALLDDLGAALSSKHTPTFSLDWFDAQGNVNNAVELTDVLVTSVSLSAGTDGSVTETSAYSYTSIKWTAGSKEAGWDVGKGSTL
jgi:type VI protein secretion system component Hcp